MFKLRDLDASEAGAAIAAGYSGVLASWYLDSGTDLRERMRDFVRLTLTGLRRLTGEKRSTHFVQPVKEPIVEEKEKK